MRQLSDQPAIIVSVAAALFVFVTTGLVGGPQFDPDTSIIYQLTFERTTNVGLTKVAIMLTQLGGAPALFAILFLAGAFLAVGQRWRDLVVMSAIVIGGRVAVELLKLSIDRPRPTFGPHPVEVYSVSFPSGHAGNSMITFLAIALIAIPPRWHGRAVGIALAASIAVGATRPFLGVHWPSDVLGGWALGIGWVVALAALTRRWRRAAE